MYQVFNVKKNRWQKFNKNGKLLGTKRTAGPYLKIPQKSEETRQEIEETEEIPQKTEESEETFQEIEEIPQKTVESEGTLQETEGIPQKTEESEESLQETEGIPQKTEESEETLQEIEGTEEIPQKTTEAEETIQEIEGIHQTKTMDEWLSDEKMELISDNGILLQNGLNLKSKFSKEKYNEMLPKLAVRNVL